MIPLGVSIMVACMRACTAAHSTACARFDCVLYSEKSVADTLVKRYEEHEDSVYKVDWSYASAWVFASLSFSGRVSISHVPPPEMYKILL